MAIFQSVNGRLTLKVDYSYSSQNIANNTSVVAYRVTIERPRDEYRSYNLNGDSHLRIVIDGQTVYNGNHSWDTAASNPYVLKTGTHTVSHHANGTKSSNISVSFDTQIHNGVMSTSGTLALPTIPRASSISDVVGVMGENIYIPITRASSQFTHKLNYQFGNISGEIGRDLTTHVSWRPPIDLARQIPNAVSGSGYIWVNTYNGGTHIGTKQFTVTLSVPSHVTPSFNRLNLIDTHHKANSIIPGLYFVKGISNIKATLEGVTGSYGSSITNYKIEIEGKPTHLVTQNGGTLGLMNFTGDYHVKATITDSRGRTFSKAHSITVLDYFSPILSFRAERTQRDAKIVDTYRHVKVAPLTVYNTQRNSITVSFKRKISHESRFEDITGGSSTNTQAEQVSAKATLGSPFKVDKSYIIVMTVADAFNTVSTEILLSSEEVVMSYSKNGVGFGKVWERGSIDSKGEIIAFDKPIQHYQLTHNDGTIKMESERHIDEIKKTGIYWAKIGNPSGKNSVYGLLHVFHISGKEVIQTFYVYDGSRQYRRYCSYSTGEWFPWNMYSSTANIPWISTGVSDVYYKQDGNTVHLRGYKQGSGDNISIGYIPLSCIPQHMMFMVPEWSHRDRSVRLKVDGVNGALQLLYTTKGAEYHFHVSWSI